MSSLPVKCRSSSGRDDWLEVADLVDSCVAVNAVLDVVPMLAALVAGEADLLIFRDGSYPLEESSSSSSPVPSEVVDLVESCVVVNVLDVVPVLVTLAVVSTDVGCLKIGSHLLDVRCWSA